MLAEFANRRPKMAGFIITMLFTVVPLLFMIVADALSGGEINTPLIVVIYAFVLQIIMWFTLERPILIMLPFGVMLVGFVASELIYTLAISAVKPGLRPSFLAMLFSSTIVTLFGAEAAGVLGALLCYGLFKTVQKFWQILRHEA